MALPAHKISYSFAEYLTLETETKLRYEYYWGEVYAMAGSSKAHNRLVNNTWTALQANKKKDCEAYTENIKVEIVSQEIYTYPDVAFTCDAQDLQDDYFIRNPLLLVEVKSRSTEDFDKGEKFILYQKLPSLVYYLLISQKQVLVECYTKQAGNTWLYQAYQSISEEIFLEKIGITLKLKDIYDSISVKASPVFTQIFPTEKK